LKILVLIGSLRAAAFSRKLANAVADAAPEGTEVAFADGRDLPLYDQDLDGEEKPAAVQVLLDQVSAADGLVFVTPEFNYGIPGPLKNAIDWASRPAYNSPLKEKPAAVVSHSIAPSGGARAHTQLTSVLSGTLTPVLVAPSITLPAIHEMFDKAGALTDELTRIRLSRMLEEFAAWIGGSGAGS
jgi:chromate reductase